MAKSSNSQKGLTSEHTTIVKAVHPTHGKREFTLYEWNMMPENKYGWKKQAEAPKSAQASKGDLKKLQSSVDSATKDVEKAQKAYDAAAETYKNVTSQTDAAKRAEQEPQAKMKMDDAGRALTAAKETLTKAESELTEAEKQ